MSNSSLITYKNVTKNKSVRKNKIDMVIIHCYVGQATAKQGCDYFASTTRKASSNYVVGKDGSIGLSVPEEYRAWTTGGTLKVNGISGADLDHRAVTIEVACETKSPYTVNAAAYNSLISLVTDICQRNGIKKLLWQADKKLVGKIDQQNMAVHRWFSPIKSCPGDYLYSKMGEIKNEVNRRLYNVPEASLLDGTDYSAVFDYEYYYNKYPDLQKAIGKDKDALLKHFIAYGIYEQRQAISTFWVTKYKENYSDLQKVYGNDWKGYVLHYIVFGQKEGRKGI